MVFVGEVYDDYEVLEDLGRKNQQEYFKMRCRICGHEKECGSSNIRRQNNTHNWANCGQDYYDMFVGTSIGDYVVESVEKTDHQYFALIRCKICGHQKKVKASELNTIVCTKHSASGCRKDYWKSFVGSQYDDLVIEELGDTNPTHRTVWCRCVKCGTRMERMLYSVIKHRGTTHGLPCIKAIPDSPYKDVICSRFANMNERCNNPNNSNYEKYGGRGIKLKYDNVVDFYYDIIDELKAHAKIHGLRNSTFDRIDVNGDYERDNIRVATQSIQCANTRRRKFFLAKKNSDVVLCDSTGEFFRKYGIAESAVGNAVRKAYNSGPARTCGWLVTKVWDTLTEEEIEDIVVTEGVTTKLLVTI